VSEQALLTALYSVAETEPADRRPWNILLVNLANCLADDGKTFLARVILGWMTCQPGFEELDEDIVQLWQSISHRTQPQAN
jgi:hypothetical protein